MEQPVFCGMWLSLAPYLLGLLREQRNDSSVFVLLEMTVLLRVVERETENLFQKTIVPKWPVCVMCGNWHAEFSVVCSFLALTVSMQMFQNSSILF